MGFLSFIVFDSLIFIDISNSSIRFLAAVREKGEMLKYIPETLLMVDLCRAAVQQDVGACVWNIENDRALPCSSTAEP